MFDKNFREKAATLLIAIFATPIHELGHWIGYKINGITAVLHYNYTEHLTNSDNIWGIAGGPIMSLLLALICLAMMFINNRNRGIWAYFSLVMCMSRLAPYCILLFNPNSFLYNDEGVIGKALGIETWLIYSIFFALFLGIIILIMNEFKGCITEFMKKYTFGYGIYLILTIVIGIKIN